MDTLEQVVRNMVIQRIPVLMKQQVVGDPLSFSFGRHPVTMKVVDADLIKPELVQYTIGYECKSADTREVRFTGKVYHREKVKSGE